MKDLNTRINSTIHHQGYGETSEEVQESLIENALDRLQKSAMQNAEALQSLGARLVPVSVDHAGIAGDKNAVPMPVESRILQSINRTREELDSQFEFIQRLIGGLQI